MWYLGLAKNVKFRVFMDRNTITNRIMLINCGLLFIMLGVLLIKLDNLKPNFANQTEQLESVRSNIVKC
jgi:hypothetical protein